MRGYFQHVALQYDNETCRTMKEYCNEKKRFVKGQQQLKFLLSCRFYGIIPKHIRNTTTQAAKLFRSMTTMDKFEKIEYNLHKKLLDLEINQTNIDLTIIGRKLYHLKLGVEKLISTQDFESFMRKQTERAIYVAKNSKEKQIKKLNTLKEKQFNKLGLKLNDKFLENRTEIEIPWEIKWLLSLGKKFALPISKESFSPLEVIADVEQCIQKIDDNGNGEKELARAKLANRVTLFKRNIKITQRDKFILAVYEKTKKFLRRHKNIVITEADKGNKTVVIYKNEYDQKMRILLEDKNTYRVIRTDPTAELIKTNNNLINDLQKGQYIDLAQKKYLYCSAATAPRIYGLPKIHKINVPLRPIVSSFQVPCYKLSKYIGNVLKNIISDKYNVKNSMQLKQQLENIKLDKNDTMVSFDVVSLFTNIPVHTAINNIMKKWDKIKIMTRIPRSKFLDLLKYCLLDNNYFMYGDNVYKQIYGMPMGNPLSPTIADIVLDNLIEIALSELKTKNINIKYLTKYVDDILAIINIEDKDEILMVLNKYHPKIQFTIEIEKNQEIAYLDTKLRREGDKIIFNWYTKEISSGRIINYYTTQPKSQILNTAKNLINRVLNISDKRYHAENIKRILTILSDNGFPIGLIRFLINSFKPSETKTLGNPENDKLFYSLKYIPGLTDRRNIRTTTDKYNITFAYKPNKTLNAIFTKTKTPIDILQQNNIVYEIPCKGDENMSCNLVYIGTTKRSLRARVDEHKKDIEKNKESTALSQHVKTTKHKPNFENTKILDKVNNTKKRYITESLRIQQKINRTMNIKEDTDNLSINYKLAIM